MEIAAEVARQLLQIKAIKLSPQSPFTWASGLKSPIYCDNRIVLSYPNVRKFIKEAFVEKAKSFNHVNMIAGVATAGIPHGALIADEMSLPFVYVRSKTKGHGRQNKIEGDLRGNENILVIEDLISTGGSCIKAAQTLESFGCRIAGIMAIFTYGFDSADKAFNTEGYQAITLSDYPTLIKEAIDCGYVTAEEKTALEAWQNDPVAWSNSMI